MARIISARAARLGALAVLALVGACGGSRFGFEGTWRGQRPVPEGDNKIIARTLGRVELTIHGTTFDLFEGGIPKTGTVRFENNVAYLKVEKFMGRPIAEQGSAAVAMNVEVRVEPLGPDAVSYHDPAGFDPQPIRLERVSQPDLDPARTPSSPSGPGVTETT